MDIIKYIEQYVRERCEQYKEDSDDHYDFWNEHIKYVYMESIKLAKSYHANLEIVSLASLLHDIALIEKVGERKDHHINGELISKKILSEIQYDEEKANQVLKCIRNHRSSLNAESIEEICVADADILAHFDNIPMLFNSAFIRNKLNLSEVKAWLKETFEKDFNDLSPKTQEMFARKYHEICNIILNEEMTGKKENKICK